MDTYDIVGVVSRWLSIKATQPSDSGDMKALKSRISFVLKRALNSAASGEIVNREQLAEDCVRVIVGQLSPDAWHSDLLHRMLKGEEPK